MTSISSSLTPYPTSGISSAAQSLITQLENQQSQPSASNMFGPAFSLDLSDAGLSALGGDDSSNSSGSASDILSALGYSNTSNNIQGDSSSFEALLASITGGNSGQNTGSSDSGDAIDQLLNSVEQAYSGATGADTSDSTSFAETALADGGPLPAFIAQVDSQLHLNTTQQQSLQNIADEYQNADNTPQTVQSIALALQQAGI